MPATFFSGTGSMAFVSPFSSVASRVEASGIVFTTTLSRYAGPLFVKNPLGVQRYSGFRTIVMLSAGTIDSNLNGPLPTGCLLKSAPHFLAAVGEMIPRNGVL